MPPIGVYGDPHVGDHASRENAHYAPASIFGSGLTPMESWIGGLVDAWIRGPLNRKLPNPPIHNSTHPHRSTNPDPKKEARAESTSPLYASSRGGKYPWSPKVVLSCR